MIVRITDTREKTFYVNFNRVLEFHFKEDEGETFRFCYSSSCQEDDFQWLTITDGMKRFIETSLGF